MQETLKGLKETVIELLCVGGLEEENAIEKILDTMKYLINFWDEDDKEYQEALKVLTGYIIMEK